MTQLPYIVYINTRQFYLCESLANALDRVQEYGGDIFERLATSTINKITLEKAVAAEREACAKVIEGFVTESTGTISYWGEALAQAIRERGK